MLLKVISRRYEHRTEAVSTERVRMLADRKTDRGLNCKATLDRSCHSQAIARANFDASPEAGDRGHGATV